MPSLTTVRSNVVSDSALLASTLMEYYLDKQFNLNAKFLKCVNGLVVELISTGFFVLLSSYC